MLPGGADGAVPGGASSCGWGYRAWEGGGAAAAGWWCGWGGPGGGPGGLGGAGGPGGRGGGPVLGCRGQVGLLFWEAGREMCLPVIVIAANKGE